MYSAVHVKWNASCAGSHGDGGLHETVTPLLVWGAGVRRRDPVPPSPQHVPDERDDAAFERRLGDAIAFYEERARLLSRSGPVDSPATLDAAATASGAFSLTNAAHLLAAIEQVSFGDVSFARH